MSPILYVKANSAENKKLKIAFLNDIHMDPFYK
jgi:hypothetical protein